MKNQKNKITTKTKQTIIKATKPPKEIHKDNKRNIKKRPTPFFRKIFHMYSPCLPIKNFWAQSTYVIKIMLSFKCHFFIKAGAFIELFRAISFSILLTFRISAIRLFIFMNFFSLDL